MPTAELTVAQSELHSAPFTADMLHMQMDGLLLDVLHPVDVPVMVEFAGAKASASTCR